MKSILTTLLLTATIHAADTIILDATGVKNLRLETVVAEERDFEETIFAIGHIAVYPGHSAAISSRIPGRALEVLMKHDHFIEKGDIAVIVESRQPGNPPPKVELTAPISGLVSAIHIVAGEPVNPDKSLAEIIDLSKVYALAQVPQQLAGKLKQGLPAHITLPAVPGKVFKAKLEHLGAMADPEAGTVEAAFVIQNPELTLRPGMRAEFDIVVSTRPNVLAVPEEAVQGDPASRVVYAKHFDLPNAFIKLPVVTGEKGGGWIEIKEGLFPGDEVVTRGSYMLGFAGGADSISLKEALDAAHGHEHAEDGSELSPDEMAEKEDDPGDHDDHESGGTPKWLIYYAGSTTILLIVFAQLWWNLKRKGGRNA